ncbi:hypothetical protein CUAC110371_06090 [Cutibacterium acnes subsp. acnes]|nr:hypothetical protein HMPREF1299_01137 [Propionibacterium sp. KPL2003]
MKIFENTGNDSVKDRSGNSGRHSASPAVAHSAHHQGDDSTQHN